MPSKISTEHPLYFDMIKAAITDLKERKGVSKQAILKYIQENYTVGDNAPSVVRTTLKRNVIAGNLIQTTGTGANGRFKIATTSAPVKKNASSINKKKTTPKKKVVSKSKSPAKKSTSKKAPVKKAVAKKTPVKKTKSGRVSRK